MAGRGFAIDQARDSTDSIRDSLELNRDRNSGHDDQTILDDHEEAERLLRRSNASPGKLQRFFGVEKEDEGRHNGRQERGRFERKSRDSTQRMSRDEAVELMHDIDNEDRASRSRTESSEGSLDLDREKLAKKHKARTSKNSRFARFAGVHVIIFIAFAALLYGAYRASRKPMPKPYIAQALSNGTSLFKPTTLLLSLDGFRADFLNRNITPHLNALVSAGVSPEYMRPSFPSVTFPNHFTLVTGLYPESHAVVGNTFWDPSLQEAFYYTDPARSMFPRFWLADPVWTSAEAANIRTAIHMWPGSEAHIGAHEPTYVDNFNAREPLDAKVDRILGLLDIPGPDSPDASETTPRPQLIAAYVPNVDAAGHKYGPNSTQIRGTIAEVDSMIGSLMAGLEARNLSSIVNIIVVSDHGMATTSVDRLVQLDDLINMSEIEHTDGWPLYGLRPKPGVDLDALYKKMKAHAVAYNGAFEVYLRDVDMPARYHFRKSTRIAPLWIVPAAGWAIVTRSDFDIAAAIKEGKLYHPRGLHGYDHEHPLMRAIFIAHGPAFAHPPGSRVPVFQNVEVYGLVCDSIGMERRPNNGTLRLPLTTNGRHEAVGQGKEEDDLPADEEVGDGGRLKSPLAGEKQGWDGLGELPEGNSTGNTATTLDEPDITSTVPFSPAFSVIPASSASDTVVPASSTAEADETANTTIPDEAEATDVPDTVKETLSEWWQWFIDKVDSVKTWASGKLTSHKGDGEGGEDNDGPERKIINEEHTEDNP